LLKTRILSNILHSLDLPLKPRRISPEMTTALLDMVRANLSRAVPLIDARYIITDDVQPFSDPDWDHLMIVYQILLRFQEIAPRCPQIDLGFMRMVFGQLGTRDEREHSAIVQVVLRHCSQSRGRSVAKLCAAVATELGQWEGSPNSMFAVALVLGIVTAIIREFPAANKAVQPLAGDCVLLITNRHFLFFRNDFFNFVSVMIVIDATFPARIISTAMRFWPHRSSSKQAVLLKLLILTSPKLPIKQYARLLPKTFAILAESITSSSARVTEAALSFLTDRLLDGFLLANAKLVITSVYGAIHDTISRHWNSDMREMAKKAANRLSLLDPRTWHELSRSAEHSPRPDLHKMQTWLLITNAATHRGHGTGGKVAQIARLFSGGETKPPALADTRQQRRASTNAQWSRPPIAAVRDATPPPVGLMPLRK
jgi:hypothetical protein